MATMAVAFPVLPGQAEAGRRFAQEALSRRQELAESFRRIGVSREEWYLQSTPQGELVIVVLEAADPRRAFQDWAASSDPFDRWFKQQAQAVSGIDFNQPLADLPERIFAWPA